MLPEIETEKVEIVLGDPTTKVNICAGLESVFKKGLTNILRKYVNIFAWSSNDMPSLDESLAMRRLNVDPNKTSKIQKKEDLPPEKTKGNRCRDR